MRFAEPLPRAALALLSYLGASGAGARLWAIARPVLAGRAAAVPHIGQA